VGAGQCSSSRLSGGTGGTKLLEGESRGVFKLDSSRVRDYTWDYIFKERGMESGRWAVQ
jgi:hypothetical protein